jgi:putative flippase GtrA
MKIIIKIISIAWDHRHKILRYIISGLVSTFVNIFIIYILTDLFDIWYLVSSVIAFTVGICVSFSLQKFWTFGNDSIANIKKQMFMYLVFALSTVCLNALVVYMGVHFLGIYYVLAQVISSAMIACVSFFVYKRVIFI